MLNKNVRLNDLQEIKHELELIKSIKYDSGFNFDYIYKWSRMIYIIKQLGLFKPGIKFFDVGGGLSPIQFILANQGCKVWNYDINKDFAHFPVNGKFHVNASAEFKHKSTINSGNITEVIGNIFETIKLVEDNSFDAVIDVCSLHLFCKPELINQFERILKPNGYLISVGDVANPICNCTEEFHYPEDQAKILASNPKLKLLEPYDYKTWDDEVKIPSNRPRKNVDLNNINLIDMHSMEGKASLWTATFVLQKEKIS